MFQNEFIKGVPVMKKALTLFIAAAALILTGCGESDDNFTAAEATGGYIIMDTRGGNIPYPNDILFAPSETEPADGTLNIPYLPTDSDAPVKAALNTLDGFSTTAPVTVGVSAEIDPATLPGNIHLYKVAATESNSTSPVPIVGAIISELAFGVDYIATQSEEKLAIVPLKPLDGGSHYMAAITKGVKATNGKSLEPDFVFSLLINNTPLFDGSGNPAVVVESDPNANREALTELAQLQQLTQQMLYVAERDRNISASNVAAIWNFTTQTIGDVAKAFADNNYSGAALGLQNIGLTSKDILLAAGLDVNSTMAGNADVYVGTLSNLPYYLGTPSLNDPLAPLQKSFSFSGGASLPNIEANLTIPVLATVPNGCGTMPANGWPVVIFQHGITQNRTNLLAISEAFASVCYAAVAIDLPLHGIDDNSSALYMQGKERTFDVDYVTQDSDCNVIAQQPDGKIDCSGTHYINLASLLTSRDNMRQSTSDFIALKNSLSAAAVSTDGLKFDSAKVAYVGHSLGAMAPFGFLSNVALKSVVLANPGGGIAQLLNNSPRFGPIIKEGLAAKDIADGSPEYESFMIATQTVIDDADPINYAAKASALQTILSFEVITDQVIPNSVSTAPLSGTDPLLNMMGAVDINTSAAPKIAVGANTKVRFTEGDHSSILDPSASATATKE
ncbi:MAG: hypothetical protein L3J42_02820, partial [Hydrogenimonas sp.]|nr:hypothetical protein [Hydrogenimonas sp.]